MKRLPDWVPRLLAAVSARRKMPHAWGSNDCCLFAADCIQAITGEDPAQTLRGSYHDQAGAEAILAAHGGLEGLATSILGEPTGPLCAHRGDICLLEGRDGLLIGVCVGHEVAAPGDKEQIMFPLKKALKAWRVG